MSANNTNPLSLGQVEADLFMAEAAMNKADSLSAKASKSYKGLAGYHLQQAAEKLIKFQIYESGLRTNNTQIYKHSLDDLITYAISLGISLDVPKWINEKKFIIASWEAQGRYDLHFVVRMDTLKKCYQEILVWKDRIRRTYH
ncbi:MAG: hypothetical protein IKP88_12200 [Lachnospiraceae bacterium]|nr:hypothetical protein [Lachnospiraceae bacterium]